MRFSLIPQFPIFGDGPNFCVFSLEAPVYGCYRLRVRPVSGVEQNISQLCSGYLQ